MLNSLYGGQGWRVSDAIAAEKSIEVRLVIEQRYLFLCPHCSARLIKHSLRETYVSTQRAHLPDTGGDLVAYVGARYLGN